MVPVRSGEHILGTTALDYFALSQPSIVKGVTVDLHWTFANGTHFLNFCQNKFQDPILSVTTVASTSEVQAAAMLVYFIVAMK